MINNSLSRILFSAAFFSLAIHGAIENILEEISQRESILVPQLKAENPRAVRVLVIGATGSGKSSLVHTLADRFFQIQTNGKVIPYDPLPGAVFNEDALDSATKIPNGWYEATNKLTFWDCPGFEDSGGYTEDIINTFSIHQLFTQPCRIKILFVLPEAKFTVQKGNLVIQSLEKLFTLIPDPEELKNCLSVVVSQGDSTNPSRLFKDLLEKTQRSHRIQITDNCLELLELLADPNAQKSYAFPAPDSTKKNDGYHKLLDAEKRRSLLLSLRVGAIENPVHGLYFEEEMQERIQKVTNEFSQKAEQFFKKVTKWLQNLELNDLRKIKTSLDLSCNDFSTFDELLKKLKRQLSHKREDIQAFAAYIQQYKIYDDFIKQILQSSQLEIELEELEELVSDYLLEMNEKVELLIEKAESEEARRQEHLRLQEIEKQKEIARQNKIRKEEELKKQQKAAEDRLAKEREEARQQREATVARERQLKREREEREAEEKRLKEKYERDWITRVGSLSDTSEVVKTKRVEEDYNHEHRHQAQLLLGLYYKDKEIYDDAKKYLRRAKDGLRYGTDEYQEAKDAMKEIEDEEKRKRDEERAERNRPFYRQPVPGIGWVRNPYTGGVYYGPGWF